MENFKKRTSVLKKYNLGGEHSKESCYQEIAKFMVESRKCQTLYANCEGSYSRRVLDLKQRNTLENFVYSTIYCNESQSWSNEQDFSKREHVKRITCAMIKASESFQVEEEIHFGVAWIYYFCYERKTIKALPVFKIYKSKTGNEAVFLDTSSDLYSSWDSYLDAWRSELPLAFLCLPRNGNYHFLGSDERKGLDLEFVCSEKVTSMTVSKRSRFESLSSAKYTPFCQIAVYPWLVKISRVGADVIRKIKVMLSTLCSTVIRLKEQCFNVVVFVILLWFHMKEKNISFVDACQMMKTTSLMLLDTVSTEDGFLKDSLSHAFLSNITGSPGSYDFKSDSESEKFQKDAKLLLELLKSSTKNWCDILTVFCDVCSNKFIVEKISSVVPLPPILSYLFLIVKALSYARQFFSERNVESSKTDNVQGKKGMILSSPADIPDSELSLQPTGSSQSVRETPECLKNEESEKISLALENFLSNSPRLDIIFSEKSMVEKFSLMFERRGEFATSDSNQELNQLVFMGERDGYGLFFIPHASLPRLTSTFGQLIEGKFIFKPEKMKVCKIVCESSRTVGHLFFPEKYCTIALVPLAGINKQTQELLKLQCVFDRNDLLQSETDMKSVKAFSDSF